MIALCKAFCLLLCSQLDISPHANQMKPAVNEAIILVFSSPAFGKFGNIKAISFVKMLSIVQL